MNSKTHWVKTVECECGENCTRLAETQKPFTEEGKPSIVATIVYKCDNCSKIFLNHNNSEVFVEYKPEDHGVKPLSVEEIKELIPQWTGIFSQGFHDIKIREKFGQEDGTGEE